MQIPIRFACIGWGAEAAGGEKREGRKERYVDILRERKKKPTGSKWERRWWMWGSQQCYILYLCLALSTLSAAKCQCQSNLCSAGISPSTARLWTPRQHRSHHSIKTLTWHTLIATNTDTQVCTPAHAQTYSILLGSILPILSDIMWNDCWLCQSKNTCLVLATVKNAFWKGFVISEKILNL